MSIKGPLPPMSNQNIFPTSSPSRIHTQRLGTHTHTQGFYGLRLTAIDDAGNDLMCLNVDFELVLPSNSNNNEKKGGAKQDVKHIDQGRRMVAPPS